MLILKTLLFAYVAVAHAIPTWSDRRSFDVESRGIDYSNFDVRDVNTNTRGVDVTATQNRKFAELSNGEKEKAKNFVGEAKLSQIQDAASPSDSIKTVHDDAKFHLDRQQRSTTGMTGKVAVQLNKPLKHAGPTTVGQVVVPLRTNPDPKTVTARLKHSINTGQEQRLPNQSKQDRTAANVAKNEEARKAKASRVSAKQQAGVDRAKAGIYKKGNGKPSVSSRR